ncbi:MAG: glycosyltransferase family 4 protein [Paucibacter sp.]|nr:glycosyltransferase family 4 protein [Roseateles sp.]
MSSKAQRVVHLTTVHPRDDIRIFHKECVSLARAGFEVFLVVGDGLGDELRQDVQIIDIGAPPAGRLRRMRQQPARALARVRALRPALLHFHDPELLPVGARLAREGILAVYDAHEDVPRQILTKQWIPAALRPWVSRAFELYENWRVGQLAAVITATPHIEARFAKQGRVALTVANYPMPEELAGELAGEHSKENAICYVGGITRTRGARELVAALPKLPGVRLLLCGRMEDAALQLELQAMPGWSQVEYQGQVDRAGVGVVMARARVGMVTLMPLPSYQDALPIKMFEYMSARLPVVASDFPLWRSIMTQAGCGLCVDPGDVNAVATAVRYLLEQPEQARLMGESGRQAVLEIYNWPQQEARLVDWYRARLQAAGALVGAVAA